MIWSDIRTRLMTLIRACYGRFSSYRIARLGMQEFTELFQFKLNGIKTKAISL